MTNGLHLGGNAGLGLGHVQLDDGAAGLLNLLDGIGRFSLAADRGHDAMASAEDAKDQGESEAVRRSSDEPDWGRHGCFFFSRGWLVGR